MRQCDAFNAILTRMSRRGWISYEKATLLADVFDRRVSRWSVFFPMGVSAGVYIRRYSKITSRGVFPPESRDARYTTEQFIAGDACVPVEIACLVCGKDVQNYLVQKIGDHQYDLLSQNGKMINAKYHCRKKICKDLYGWIMGKNPSCSRARLNYSDIPPSAERKAYLSAMYLDRRINRFIKIKNSAKRTINITIQSDSGMVSTDWVRRCLDA